MGVMEFFDDEDDVISVSFGHDIEKGLYQNHHLR
jgi:hypothetical protein